MRGQLGVGQNLAAFYPEARWQRCVVHFYREVWTLFPVGTVTEVAAMLEAVRAQESCRAARDDRSPAVP